MAPATRMSFLGEPVGTPSPNERRRAESDIELSLTGYIASLQSRHEMRSVTVSEYIDNVLDPKRLIVVNFQPANTGIGNVLFGRHQIPATILRHIPQLQSELESRMYDPEYNPYQTITINSEQCYDEQVWNQAMDYLQLNTLAPLQFRKITDTLQELIHLYRFSVDEGISKLENGIIQHIKNFKGMTMNDVLALARYYYDVDEPETDILESKLAFLIKDLLRSFRKEIIAKGEAQKICEQRGLLGQQWNDIMREIVAFSEDAITISEDDLESKDEST